MYPDSSDGIISGGTERREPTKEAVRPEKIVMPDDSAPTYEKLQQQLMMCQTALKQLTKKRDEGKGQYMPSPITSRDQRQQQQAQHLPMTTSNAIGRNVLKPPASRNIFPNFRTVTEWSNKKRKTTEDDEYPYVLWSGVAPSQGGKDTLYGRAWLRICTASTDGQSRWKFMIH